MKNIYETSFKKYKYLGNYLTLLDVKHINTFLMGESVYINWGVWAEFEDLNGQYYVCGININRKEIALKRAY